MDAEDKIAILIAALETIVKQFEEILDSSDLVNHSKWREVPDGRAWRDAVEAIRVTKER